MPNPRLTIASGGAIETALLPFWLRTIQLAFPAVEIEVALTEKAERFVTELGIRGVTGDSPYTENGPQFRDSKSKPLHYYLADADVILVCPATPRVIVDMAMGSITCPATRVVAFAEKERVIIAPWIHDRLDREVYRPHLEILEARGHDVADTLTLSRGESPWPLLLSILQRRFL